MKQKVYYQENHKVKTMIIGAMDIYPKNVIKIKPLKPIQDYLKLSFNSYDAVVDIFKELNMILQTNLSLDESLDILLKTNQDKQINEFLSTIKIAINNAQPIDIALKKHKKQIGLLPILFFKLGSKDGDFKSSINALSIILVENQKAKKKIMQALSYPIVLTITLFISFVFIFNFVIPNFEHIFVQFGSNLPYATKSLLAVKSFFDNFYLEVIIFLLFIIYLGKYFYSKKKVYIDKFIATKLFFISKLYKRFILYRFFLSLKMIINSHHQFQTAIENAKLVVSNQYILSQINKIIFDMKNGNTISKAFKNSNLFDDLTIRLLNTAQHTNTIPLVLENITTTYRQKLDDDIDYFSKAIGPIFILIISAFILWIIFALMLPIWDLGKVLN